MDPDDTSLIRGRKAVRRSKSGVRKAENFSILSYFTSLGTNDSSIFHNCYVL